MKASITRFVAVLLTSASLFVAVPALACGPYAPPTVEMRIQMAERSVEYAAEDFVAALASKDKKAQAEAWAYLVSERERLAELRATNNAELARR